ncbi:hypothetical protein EON65_04345 [archaeon]|nr:MAG: hypothetical protein EON65_04345 [archaeon]
MLEDAGWPSFSIWKGDQWILLTRRDAELIRGLLYLPHIAPMLPSTSSTSASSEAMSSIPLASVLRHGVFRVMKGVRASDEVFFPSLLSLLWGKGLLEETKEGENKADGGQTKVKIRCFMY